MKIVKLSKNLETPLFGILKSTVPIAQEHGSKLSSPVKFTFGVNLFQDEAKLSKTRSLVVPSGERSIT